MVELTSQPPPDWQGFALAHGEFYHDSRWVCALQGAFGYPMHCLTARRGGAVAGLLALAEVPAMVGPRRLVSLPFSYAAGPLALDPEAALALQAAAIDRAREIGARRVEIKQVLAVAPNTAPAYIRRTRYAAFRLATDGGEAAVLQRLHGDSTRRGIRKAERAGVQVRMGSASADWLIMAQLEEATARSHGVPAPPRRFFLETCTALQAGGLAELYLAELPGDPVPLAAIVIWKGPRRWIYAFGASRPESLSVRPNHALLWRAIREAIQAGIEFDFGRAAPEQAGLVEFKRRWGGVEVPLAYDYWPDAGGLNTGDRSRGPLAWMAAAWSALPAPVTRVGSVLYRYLG